MRIELVTSNGGFVALIEIPLYVTPPEVVQWGSRTFVRRGAKYAEAFAVVSLTPPPGFRHPLDRDTQPCEPPKEIK